MSQSSLFFEGINLLMLGMGFVASFLTLLVGATTAMSKVAQHFVVAPEIKVAPAQTQQTDQAALVAVMTAAIHHHNKKQLI